MSPGIYSFERKGKDSSHIRTRCWIVTTVAMILKREAYIGTAEQFSTTVVSYRDKRQIRRSPEERIRVENAYPAIIDRETWEAVQEINRCASEKCAHRAKAQKSLFSGLLVCSDCGLTMSYWNPTKNYRNGQRIGYANFQCRTFQSTGGVVCSKHTISESALKAILHNHIKQLSEQIALDENAMLDSLKNRFIGTTALSQAEAKKETRRLKRDLHKLQAEISNLYENWALGEVNEEDFTDSMQEHETERQDKEQRLALLAQSEQESADKLADIERWMQLIRKNADLEDINRELLESLVEKIEVGVCGDQQAVRIYYKFVGLL